MADRDRFQAEFNDLENWLIEAAAATDRTYSEIFIQSADNFPVAIQEYSSRMAQCLMQQERLSSRPRIPASAERLSNEVLSHHPRTRSIFKGHVTTRESIALFYGDNEMLAHLNNAHEIIICSNESLALSEPNMHQQLRISEFPVLYIQIKQPTHQLYLKIWDKVLLLCPALQQGLLRIFSDLDYDLVKATHSKFPNVEIKTYWYYYLKSVHAKWRDLNMDAALNDILHKAWTIPLMPLPHFAVAVDHIRETHFEAFQTHPQLTEFVQYLMLWEDLRSKIVTNDTSYRYNTLCMGFDNKLVPRLGGDHADTWEYHALVKREIVMVKTSWWKLHAGMSTNFSLATTGWLNTDRINHFRYQLYLVEISTDDFITNVLNDEMKNGIQQLLVHRNNHIGRQLAERADLMITSELGRQENPLRISGQIRPIWERRIIRRDRGEIYRRRNNNDDNVQAQ